MESKRGREREKERVKMHSSTILLIICEFPFYVGGDDNNINFF